MKRTFVSRLLLLVLLCLPAGACATTADTVPGSLDWLLTPVTSASDPRGARATDVRVAVQGESMAILQWTTDIAATEEVQYGPVDGSVQPLLTLRPAKEHVMTLSNLLRGTVYRYAIASRNDVSGTFVTAGIPALRYRQILETKHDPHTLELQWTTNLPADYYLGFRVAGETEWTVQKSAALRQATHTVRLAGLQPETEYEYLIQSSDSSGYTVNTGLHRVTTPENNRALGRPVTGTFTEYHDDPYVVKDTDPLANITDGDDAFFSGMVNSGDVHAAEQWVTVDLGRELVLRRIVTVWRRLAYPQAFRLLASSDGEEWTLIDWNLNAADGVASYSRRGDPILTHTQAAAGQRARYVKVLLTRGSRFYVKHPEWRFVTLAEVKVFADEE